MIKVNYTKTTVKKLHAEYFNYIDPVPLQHALDDLLAKKAFASVTDLPTVKQILTAKPDKLWDISAKFSAVSAAGMNQLKKVFNYDNAKLGKRYQPDIARFFMHSENLSLAVCFYCNMDHIYAFKKLNDYQDGWDLIQRGTPDDWLLIDKIGKIQVRKIKEEKKSVASVDDLSLKPEEIENLKSLKSERSNHFTLDHVLLKSKHPIAALSLYNLVPCCSNCNSKFKGKKHVVTCKDDCRTSPSAANFLMDKDMVFELMFPTMPGRRWTDIKTAEDFVLQLNNSTNDDAYKRYKDIFKLDARYVFHKKEVLRLIQLHKRYSQTQLKEIAAIAKTTSTKVAMDIFGKEIFDVNTSDVPLTKLRRDIARFIKIKDAL